MSDLKTIAEGYIAAWNETDAARRATLIAAAFTADIRYRDPLMQGDGHAGIDALITAIHQRFPGFRFSLKGEPDGFAENIRFSWGLGPDSGDASIEGTDFAVIADGRMAFVTGFLDTLPR